MTRLHMLACAHLIILLLVMTGCSRQRPMRITSESAGPEIGNLMTYGEGFIGELRRVTPVSNPTVNEEVVWEVSVKGGTGRFRLDESSEEFTDRTSFVRLYSQPAKQEQESIAVSMMSLGGEVLQTIEIMSPPFDVIGLASVSRPSPATPAKCEIRRGGAITNVSLPHAVTFLTSGTVTSAIVNGQAAANGAIVSVAPLNSIGGILYTVVGKVVGPSGVGDCSLQIKVPTCSIKVLQRWPDSATIQVFFFGDVASVSLNGKMLQISSPPPTTMTLTGDPRGAGAATITVSSHVGDQSSCTASLSLNP